MKVKEGKYNRRVFIAGVGCTPFRLPNQDADFETLTEGEYFGWAALDAMDDAGVTAPEVQGFSDATASAMLQSNYITPAAMMARWCGLNNRHCYGHNEGCCSSYVGVMLGAQAIASGQFDIFLVGAQDENMTKAVLDKPAIYRMPTTAAEQQSVKIQDRAYTIWNDATVFLDQETSQYRMKHGLTIEQIDDALIGQYKNCRYNSEGNFLAFKHDSLEAEAKQFGFDDVDVYLRSPFDPKITEYQRAAFCNMSTHGAAACVLVCEDKAKELMKKGVECVEILGCSNVMCESYEFHLAYKATKEAMETLTDVTGLSGKDVDLFLNNDFVFPTSLPISELVGYIPEGEAWKYFIEGKTRYDAERPMQTNGGRAAYGHSTGVSGLADFYEAVMQIRGKAHNQMPTPPEKVLLRGHGGMQNIAAFILAKYEG